MVAAVALTSHGATGTSSLACSEISKVGAEATADPRMTTERSAESSWTYRTSWSSSRRSNSGLSVRVETPSGRLAVPLPVDRAGKQASYEELA